MRALAKTGPDSTGFYPKEKRFVHYGNDTLSELWNLYPKNTSCIYIDMKLWKDYDG